MSNNFPEHFFTNILVGTSPYFELEFLYTTIYMNG